jgi:hypothetical protein
MKLPKCPVCNNRLPFLSLLIKPGFTCPTCKNSLFTNMRLVSFVESLIGLPVLVLIAWVVDVNGYNESTYEKILLVLIAPVGVLHYFVFCRFLRISKTE